MPNLFDDVMPDKAEWARETAPPGNVNLKNRPQVKNPDGTISTIRSISINEDGKEILIPTVSQDGKILSDMEAINLYHKTGQHLGKFKTIKEANDYAIKLHKQQESLLTEENMFQEVIPKPEGMHPFERALREEQKPLEIPWVDPVSAFAGGFTGAGLVGLRAGAGILTTLGKATLSGTLGAAMDFPIGTATDLVAKNHPYLALPFAVLVGMTSGMTLEKYANAKVISAFSRARKIPIEKLTETDFSQISKISAELDEVIQAGRPQKADEILERRITELAQEAIVPSVSTKSTAEHKAGASITELAEEARIGPKKPWQRTAEDLLQELRDQGKLKGKPVEPEIPTKPAELLPEEPISIKPKVPAKPTSTPDEPPRLVNEDGSEIIPGRLSPDAAETTRELARKYANSETDVEDVEKYVDSINFNKIDTTDDAKRLMVDVSKEISPKIQSQRRGQVSHDETTRMAIRSGITEKQLLKLKPGHILNAEESLAASMINTASAKRTIEAAKKVVAGEATEQDLLDFRLMIERHQIIQAAESGLATEAGRALSARNIIRNAEQIKLKNLSTMIEALGGREVTEEMARRLAMIDPDNVQQVNRFLQTVTLANTTDKIFEVWVNSLLSSPVTHAANSISNFLTFAMKFPEKATAVGFDALRTSFTGQPRTRYLGEVSSEVFGVMQGLRTGVRGALWSFRTGLPTEFQSKLEVRTFHAVKGTKGDVIRLPGRALVAADEFFKALNYSTELHGLAFRTAVQEGLTGKARATRIAQIIADPMSEIDDKARAEMLYRTFQKPMSSFMGTIARARMSGGVGGTIFRFIVPFMRTPTNIAKYGLERTPIGFIYTVSKQIGKQPFTPGEFADRIGRAAFGTVVGAAVYSYALEGRFTGAGPKDKVKRDALYRIGWQPYSFKIGDKYYSYKRLEPLGSIIGMAADMAEASTNMEESEWGDLINRMVTSLSKNITSKTFLRGVSDVLDAVSDPERYGPAWVNSFGGTVIPRVVVAGARASDDYLRQTPDLASYIQSEIPYLSQELLPKRNIWGEPLEREGSFIMKFASPVSVSKEKGSKADIEIVRLGVSIGKTSNKIFLPGEKKPVELDPKQYDILIVQGGTRAKKMIGDFVFTSGYEKIPDEGKATILKNLYESAMNIERTRMTAELVKQRRQK